MECVQHRIHSSRAVADSSRAAKTHSTTLKKSGGTEIERLNEWSGIENPLAEEFGDSPRWDSTLFVSATSVPAPGRTRQHYALFGTTFRDSLSFAASECCLIAAIVRAV